MARTVAGTRPQPSDKPQPSRFKFRGRGACGYCTVLVKDVGVRHDLCSDSPDNTWRCRCALQGHKEGQ